MHFIYMDFELLASEWLRALRGRRSQTALSRRLKYKSNIAYLWESGRAYPTLARTFEVARATGLDPVRALGAFFGDGGERPWLGKGNVDPVGLVTPLLDDLRAGVSLTELGRRTGFSRFAIGRWLDGQTEPRLPQALALIEACSLRALDFVASFVDPASLPSFAGQYRDLQAARRAAYELPFSQVVVHALELDAYAALPGHQPGFLADLLGIEPALEETYLQTLLAAGQIRFDGTRYLPTRVQAVDTRGDVRSAASLKAYFAQLAVDRLRSGVKAASGYNVFAVSEADYVRIEQLQRSYFTQLRTIVASSEPTQVVGLASTQLMALTRG
ncbi:MAG: DUF4423 domain-containing protein [Myxococcales bacterium]|nr:DUF4423 domain-containing protein [Myxococcales bacterium]